MKPDHVDEFLALDHEVWTLGGASLPGFEHMPFLSKEVWLDESRPGRVTLVYVWESHEAWQAVSSNHIQERLQSEFDSRFPHDLRLEEAWHEDSNMGLYRWSRYER